ncbi:MAG: hypothetical protein Fur0022_34580 [Anaerolineales bacterium]
MLKMENPLKAGQTALQKADWKTAKTCFEMVLQEGDIPEARDGLGLALWWLNEVSAAHEQRTRAYLGFKARGDRKRAAHLAAWLAREQVFLRANHSAMQGWFARAESLLAEAGECVERGWVDIYRATMENSISNLEIVAMRVVALARQFQDADLEAFALVNAGYACVASGRIQQGMTRIDEAMTAATSGEVTDLFVITETFCVTLSACELAGDLERTTHWCKVAMEYAQKYECPFLSAYCRTTYGGLLVATGRWQDAESALTDAIQAFDQGHVALRVHAVLKLADLRVSQGRLEEAEVLLVGYEDHESAVMPLARLHLLRGELPLSRALLENALRTASPSPLHRAPLLRLLVDVLLAIGDLPEARKMTDELITSARETGSVILTAQAELALGQFKRFSGETGAAERFYAALEHLRAFEQSLLAGRTKLELARTIQHTDHAAAVMWARAALASFERMGAVRDVDEATQVLRGLGVAGRPGTRQPEALSQREREVLNLLAHGLTNREIADRLFISAKTVEHHVGHILSKLNLRSRAEAAAYVTSLSANK